MAKFFITREIKCAQFYIKVILKVCNFEEAVMDFTKSVSTHIFEKFQYFRGKMIFSFSMDHEAHSDI